MGEEIVKRIADEVEKQLMLEKGKELLKKVRRGEVANVVEIEAILKEKKSEPEDIGSSRKELEMMKREYYKEEAKWKLRLLKEHIKARLEGSKKGGAGIGLQYILGLVREIRNYTKRGKFELIEIDTSNEELEEYIMRGYQLEIAFCLQMIQKTPKKIEELEQRTPKEIKRLKQRARIYYSRLERALEVTGKSEKDVEILEKLKSVIETSTVL